MAGVYPHETMRDVRAAIGWAVAQLGQTEAKPRLAAEWLVGQVTGLSRLEIYMQFDRPFSVDESEALAAAVARRLAGEPLQYILGKAAFRRLELAVRPGVLIPRPETEQLVELVLGFLLERRPQRVLDIGCGSGAIALSLLQELPDCVVWATDIDAAAVALTLENAERLGLDDARRFVLQRDDLATSLLADPQAMASFDVVVSNPPYVPTALLAGLPREVREFEPMLALDGGADGLAVFSRILEQAALLLRSGGLLAVELHEETLEAAAEMASAAGLADVQVHHDLAGRPRYLTAQQGG